MSSSFVVSGRNEVTSIWFPANGASHYVWLNILIDIKKTQTRNNTQVKTKQKKIWEAKSLQDFFNEITK